MFTGENLRSLRLIKGIPQKAVAKKMGVSQPAVSKIEHSKNVSAQTSEKYAGAANGSMEELKKLKNILPPPPINRIAVLRRML